MTELTNVRVWYDSSTGQLLVAAEDPTDQHHGDLLLKETVLRFEHGGGSSITAYLRKEEA